MPGLSRRRATAHEACPIGAMVAVALLAAVSVLLMHGASPHTHLDAVHHHGAAHLAATAAGPVMTATTGIGSGHDHASVSDHLLVMCSLVVLAALVGVTWRGTRTSRAPHADRLLRQGVLRPDPPVPRFGLVTT